MSSHTLKGKKAISNPQFKAWGRVAVLTVYLLFLLIPIYWLVNMSFKSNSEI